MKNAFKFIAIAILVGISFLAVNAQDVIVTNEGSVVTEKVENKVEAKAKRQASSDDNSWTGFYVGGYVGNTNGRASANTSTIFVPNSYFATSSIPSINSAGSQRLKSSGFTGGVTAGYNHKKGNFFVGGEVDFGSSRINKSVSATTTYPCCATYNFTITQSVKSDWMLTARPRGGLVLKKALLYVTGGLAVTNVKYDAKFTDTFGHALETGSFKRTKVGWTAGAGMEFKVSNRWSVKGEYLFSQFGRTSTTSNNLTEIAPGGSVVHKETFTHSTDLKSHSIRFGVNYRF